MIIEYLFNSMLFACISTGYTESLFDTGSAPSSGLPLTRLHNKPVCSPMHPTTPSRHTMYSAQKPSLHGKTGNQPLWKHRFVISDADR